MASLRAIKEETDNLSAGFVMPSFLIHEYVVNAEGMVVEKKLTASSNSEVEGSRLAGKLIRVVVDVEEEDCLLVARRMLPLKSLFQKTIAAFLDQVYFNKSPGRLLNEFLVCICVKSTENNDLFFDADKKLKIDVLKSFRNAADEPLRNQEINSLMFLPAVQTFINYFDESDQAQKDFDQIKRDLLRDVGHFLHQQTEQHNKVLVLNMAHPSLRGGHPDLPEQEEHLYRAIAGLTALEKHEKFRTTRLHKDKFSSVATLLVRDATVFRQGAEFEYKILYPSEQYEVDVLYSAAPSEGRAEERERNLRRAIYAQLLTAKKMGYKKLVLNAFGCCGEFKNNPTTVVELYRETFNSSTFRYAFDCVHFAIASNPVNLTAFKKEFPRSSSLFPQEGFPCQSAFRLIPRSNTSSRASGSSSSEGSASEGSAGTTRSVLVSAREAEGEIVRGGSTEFFKSASPDRMGTRRGSLTPA